MSNMAVTNKVKDSIVNKSIAVLADMGFQRSDIEEAVTDLINQGTSFTSYKDIEDRVKCHGSELCSMVTMRVKFGKHRWF